MVGAEIKDDTDKSGTINIVTTASQKKGMLQTFSYKTSEEFHWDAVSLGMLLLRYLWYMVMFHVVHEHRP